MALAQDLIVQVVYSSFRQCSMAALPSGDASKARVGIHKVMDSNILIRRLDKRHYFGFETLQERDYYLPYSDIEKTLIDMLVFRQPLSPQMDDRFKAADIKKLHEYLKAYSSRTRQRVLNTLRVKPYP